MKKIIGAFLIALSLVATGCLHEEEDIFGKSAAIRAKEFKEGTEAALAAAPNGWVMHYFPNPTTEGYTYLMKFGTGGNVTMAGKNKYLKNQYKEEISLWEVILDNGPVLTFNSYNTIFHIFADPIDPDNNPDLEGKGLEGDYEFIVLEYSDSQIKLKGKKHGAYVLMSRLADGQNWEDYFKSLDNMNTFLFGNTPNNFYLRVEDTYYTMYDGTTHIFNIVPEGGNRYADGDKVPFIVTPDGLRLYSVFSVGGTSVQDFKLADKKLISNGFSVDGGNALDFYNQAVTPEEPSRSSANRWIVEPAKDMSPKVKAVYDRIVASCSAVGRTVQLSFYYYGKNQSDVLRITTKRSTATTEGYLNFEKTISSESVAYSYKGTGDQPGLMFYKDFDGFKDFVELVNTDFTVSADEPLVLSSLKMQSKNDPDVWFYVSYK